MIILNFTITITRMQEKDLKALKILGERIRTLRKETGESLDSFIFSRGGTTSASLSRVENGLVDVKFTTLLKIASALKKPLDEVLKNLDFDYSVED